mmetsp:Transcript_18795/g.56026  ORF Transcript_18795/g.56026 Transcript_18795/m.56026 type:complete len:211 (-) Transcript_18795:173-805(-)
MLTNTSTRAASSSSPARQFKAATTAPRAARTVRLMCRASAEPEQRSIAKWGAAAAAAVGAVVLSSAPLPAVAVPQTSVCATESCDGMDFSNKDLRTEFYTKGSLKGANFSKSNLTNVSLFGANLADANLSGANFSLANLGQANLEGANLSQTNVSGAIMSSARFNSKTILDGADFTDVIVRKDVNDLLCKLAKGTNEMTGNDTRESLNCF